AAVTRSLTLPVAAGVSLGKGLPTPSKTAVAAAAAVVAATANPGHIRPAPVLAASSGLPTPTDLRRSFSLARATAAAAAAAAPASPSSPAYRPRQFRKFNDDTGFDGVVVRRPSSRAPSSSAAGPTAVPPPTSPEVVVTLPAAAPLADGTSEERLLREFAASLAVSVLARDGGCLGCLVVVVICLVGFHLGHTAARCWLTAVICPHSFHHLFLGQVAPRSAILLAARVHRRAIRVAAVAAGDRRATAHPAAPPSLTACTHRPGLFRPGRGNPSRYTGADDCGGVAVPAADVRIQAL
ncbi:hypothetical protein HK405_013539, partial [Cladochytrium tenue]